MLTSRLRATYLEGAGGTSGSVKEEAVDAS